MQIKIAKSAGFCFGVKRALDIALKTAGLKQKVYMLGDIVHNEQVVSQIQDAGIKKIKRLGQGKGRALLIRAHGESLATINTAKKLGYNIIDATCPMVKEIQRIAQDMERKGYKIIIIGDKQHDEVLGIAGQINSKALIIEGLLNIPIEKLKRIKKACVVVQSTQNIEKARLIVSRLRLYLKELRFFNTICRPTTFKQQEIRKMPKENDVMVIIGSKASANTRRLFEISRSLNKRSYWVSSKEEIAGDWFREAESVGVTSGASTPDKTTQEIVGYIKQIAGL
jgi:4-hydroxy-3-methylbut-2-enyl diphosphate reductase